MNILFLTTHANTGGITSYILTLGEGLVKKGHKVWVASSGGDCVPRIEAGGMRYVKLNIRTKSEVHPKLWLSLPQLKFLIKHERIDIIHAQTRVTQVLGAWAGRSSGIPMITTCHGFFKPRWFRRTFPCWGAAVIAISKPVAQHLRADFKVSSNRIQLIPNGIDLNRFVVTDEKQRGTVRQRWNMDGNPMIGLNTPLIGIVARLSSVKGIDVLIKAMPLVLKEIPLARLMITGQGPEEKALKQLTQELSLTDKVRFENTVDQTPELLGAFDVFVMPSIMEGLGLSVMEAQACGIPVVASSIGGLVDLIEDGKSGYLVAVNDISSLADRIVKVLKDPQGSKIMAQQARINIERHFSAELMVEKTVNVYSGILKYNSPPLMGGVRGG